MRLLFLTGLALFAFLPAYAQDACRREFDTAQQALDAFEPRTADSLATQDVRRSWQRARSCYETLPALDSTAANNYAKTFGREVQVLWETRDPVGATTITDAFLNGPHLRADSSGVRYMLEWRAFILDFQDDVEGAIRTRRQLLDYAPSATPAVRARIWTALGASYQKQGQWSEALAIYRALQRELTAEPELDLQLRVALARALTQEAQILVYEKHVPGKLHRAFEAVHSSLRLLSEGESSREQHYRVFALMALAEAYRARIEVEDGAPALLDSALVAARRAADLAGRLERPAPLAEMAGWEEVGRVLGQQNQYAESIEAFEHALLIGEESGVAVRREALLNQIANVAMSAGDYARADTLIEQSIHLVEAERARHTAETEAALSRHWYDTYLARVSLFLHRGQTREAFLALDGARARVLRDLRRRRFTTLAPADRARADSLAASIENLHGRFNEGDLSPTEAAQLQGEIHDVEAERGALYGEVTVEMPSLERIQAALAERGQVLVTHFFNPPHTAFVLRPDTLIAVPLDAGFSYPQIRALMRATSPQWMRSEGPVSVSNTDVDLAPLKTLYDYLIGPVAAHLPEGIALVVVPEGPLAQLPFGLLVEEDPGRFQFSDAPFLLRRYPVSTELAAALIVADDPLPPASDLVAFGRTMFGGVEVESPLRSAYADGPPPDLPSVGREIRDIADRFPSAIVALDGEATESRLYEWLGSARLLHLASHAFVEDDAPLNSFIQLSPDSTEDGRLYLHELLARPLAASLVVLSGCRTARGRELLGEGTLGLQYAVRAAGAESTMGTLWRVDDAATVELMDRFYKHLARGERKDVALQRAQVEYLDAHDGLRASPFFWGAPVLYGDPRPIPLPRSSSPWWWVAGLGLIAVALVVPRFSSRFASP